MRQKVRPEQKGNAVPQIMRERRSNNNLARWLRFRLGYC
jgi:hypothetical protein